MQSSSAPEPALIGIDVGTQSIRSIAFDRRGRKLAASARATPTSVLAVGGEYDPEAVFAAVLATLAEVARDLARATRRRHCGRQHR